MYLEAINNPADIKKLEVSQLQTLADETRSALINKISKAGGHQGPNLGVVELTVAIHYVFDSPRDKIVFDVSHQCYPHKILTGRKHFLMKHILEMLQAIQIPVRVNMIFLSLVILQHQFHLLSGLQRDVI